MKIEAQSLASNSIGGTELTLSHGWNSSFMTIDSGFFPLFLEEDYKAERNTLNIHTFPSRQEVLQVYWIKPAVSSLTIAVT